MNNKLGVLLAVSSLPGNHGIGDFGSPCFKFIDWLSENHYSYWQTLPLNPVGPGYSPYMSSSSKALEYRYISLDLLAKSGLISKVPVHNNDTSRVDYYDVGEFKKRHLALAFKKFMKNHSETLHKFKTQNPWVSKYATFEVFKELNGMKIWNEWDIEYLDYFKYHKNPPRHLKEQIDFVVFLQYIALKQWKKVLRYARKKGIKIICDMPFYVGYDGVECWLNREQFSIGPDNKLFEVGGVGPDAFSDVGQLWGSPIYNFEKMKEDGYSLLIDRIHYLASLCDYLRIDHFRAFDTYYVIPASEKNAVNGVWKLGPREDFFDRLYEKYPNINLIAEDLGDLRPEVLELRDEYHLPGMFISQFTIFDLNNHSTDHQLVYPGTHDNETLYGWYLTLNDDQKWFIANRIGVNYDEHLFDNIVKYIFTIPSMMTIFQLQDLLKLDNSARMNFPGTVGSPNWEWKLKDFNFTKEVKYPDFSWFE
ncbi:MAG: 4-alpha-glucanotransferase [Bacilli bacterium]|nr:4-alpha-glucanotransferase [Bacilli bacterium]